tara:strand:+ start:3979 stop:4296 length:318 start_codon:yes stop_codon:yes gene_type:complete
MKLIKLEKLNPIDEFQSSESDFVAPKNTHRIEYSIESRIVKWYLDENGEMLDYEEGEEAIGNAITEDYSKVKTVWEELYCNFSGDDLLKNLYEMVMNGILPFKQK